MLGGASRIAGGGQSADQGLAATLGHDTSPQGSTSAGPTPAQASGVIERPAYTLTYPGDWKLDDEDTSFDLDRYFSIDGPETCHVIIPFFPPTLTEEACLDIQNETFTERMFKEAPTEAPFSTWGSLSYLLHDSARRQWQLIAARQPALTASKRDSTKRMNPQRTTAERRTRAPRHRRTVVPLPRPAGTAR